MILAVAALGSASMFADAGVTYARSNNTTKPVIFLHGWSGQNCNADWNELMVQMRNAGWTGGFHVIKFLSNDVNCSSPGGSFWNSSLFGYGTHSDIYGHSGTTHDNNTDLRHLAWHLAWWLHDWYAGDPPMDIVAHSMGGLIIRYALMKEGNSCGCPLGNWPNLQIEDVVTLGTPHQGANFVNLTGTTQGDQMTPNSFFLNQLRDSGWNPQGDGGTEWTVIGATYPWEDEIVSATSATYMGAARRLYYHQEPGGHSQYMHDAAVPGGPGHIYDWASGNWYYYPQMPYGTMAMTRAALQYGGW